MNLEHSDEKAFGDFKELKQVSILAVAQYLGVQVMFGNKVRCPNPAGHSNGDKNPSVSIFPNTNSFRCWVCEDIKGDVLKFAQVFGRIDPDDWRQMAFVVSAAAGLPTSEFKQVARPKRAVALLPEHIEGMNALMRLSSKPDSVSASYLRGRKIDPTIAARYGVRCLENAKDVQTKLVSLYGIEHAAIAPMMNEKKNLRFRMHRLLFPYLTPEHEVVYIQGRDPTRKAGIKELAVSIPPTFPWMPAGHLLPGVVWICEGVIDALTLISHGVSAIAIPGARTWRPEWSSFLLGRDVIIAMDPDLAGNKGADDILATLKGVNSVKVAHLPAGKDINKMATEGNLYEFITQF
jgi:DNA primase